MLPSDAERSRLRGVVSLDVQILLKNIPPSYVPLQFPYIINSYNKPIQKNALRFQWVIFLWFTNHKTQHLVV